MAYSNLSHGGNLTAEARGMPNSFPGSYSMCQEDPWFQVGGKESHRRPVLIKLVSPIGNYPIPPTPSILPAPHPLHDVRDTVDSHTGSDWPSWDPITGCARQTSTAQVPRCSSLDETVTVADRGRSWSSGIRIPDPIRDSRYIRSSPTSSLRR